jgi:hypothetical protein
MDKPEVIHNKRGRKPKKNIIPTLKTYNNTDTPIIAHLPIDYFDILDEQNSDIFVKPDPIKHNIQHNVQHNVQSNDKEMMLLKIKIEELTHKNEKKELCIIKPSVQPLVNNNSKCWWCTYSFDTPAVELPEHYYNNLFFSSGKFCSYNCAMAYNIDINDENVSKRNSLLYLHYKKTYNTDILINPSPSWKILKDYGGTIDINDYRNNFISNKINYLYIKPPLVSRISYVEQIPVNDSIELVKTNDYLLKRKKPLNSTKYSLESTIGLKKIINTN